MKKLSMILMGCSLLTLLSFQLPTENTPTEEYLLIDTNLGELEMDSNAREIDFDSETF